MIDKIKNSETFLLLIGNESDNLTKAKKVINKLNIPWDYLNYDLNKEQCMNYNVRKLPFLIIYRDGMKYKALSTNNITKENILNIVNEEK